MVEADGLSELVDGPGQNAAAPANVEPVSATQELPLRLWVVRDEDVVHALERCPFGDARKAGVIKHTNLTGGNPAFSGGELLFLNDGQLIVSGDSGRYGPRDSAEMSDVASAFQKSGYTVYSTGYDDEVDRPLPLVGPVPQLI